MTLEEALALLAQPKQRGGRAAAAPPLRELGNDPVSGKPMLVKNGRFGPYVTDGELNASLRSGDTVETLTPERARRAPGGPAGGRHRRKNAANRLEFVQFLHSSRTVEPTSAVENRPYFEGKPRT